MLAGGKISRAQLIAMFADGEEFRTKAYAHAMAALMYLAFWSAAIAAGTPLQAVIDAFVGCAEYGARQ